MEIVQPAGNGGSSTALTVTDGVTTVTPVTTIDFTSGATVTNGGGGIANVAITTGGSGTVTSVSVVAANGFAGTVATATTTPAITLTTSITGLLKGNGTAISAATAGTDYQAPVTLTTTGTSGAATFISNTLNIPQYQASGTYVTSVTGTTNRITSSGGTTPAIDISASYVGQSSITTLGTIGTGVWNAGAVTSSGLVTGTAFVPTSSTVPTNGIYLPAANTLGFAINSAAEVQLTATALAPAVSAGNALGTTTLQWANLFLTSGAAIDWSNGTMTLTQAASVLTVAGGDLKISSTAGTTSTSVVTVGGTQTLSNKRTVKLSAAVSAPGATPSINTDTTVYVDFTGVAANITSMTTNLTGTPNRGDTLWVTFTGTGSFTLAWGTGYEASTVPLPTGITTTRQDVGLVWNTVTSKWRCVAVA